MKFLEKKYFFSATTINKLIEKKRCSIDVNLFHGIRKNRHHSMWCEPQILKYKHFRAINSI